MSARKKRLPDNIEMAFGEALARFIQTDPKELEKEYAKITKDSEEIERYVGERQESIRRGARRAKKRFRL